MSAALRNVSRRARIAFERLRARIDRLGRGDAAGRTQIVICGFPRSGTSLLYNMLAVALPGYRNDPFESHATHRIWRYENWITKRPLDVLDLNQLVARNVLDKRLIAVIPIRDLRDLVTSVHPNVPGDYFIGWKSSYRVGLSDGRSPVPTSPGLCAIAEQIRRARHLPGIEVVFVSYEQLVQDPDSAGKELERRVGVTFERSFSSFHRYPTEHPYRYDSEHLTRAIDATLERERSAPDPERVGKWRRPEHRERILSEFSENPDLLRLLREYGYEPDDEWFRSHGGAAGEGRHGG